PEREELVLQARRWIAPPHFAIDLIRALARSSRGEKILAALLVGHAEVIPLRAPLFIPEKLRVPLERREPTFVTAALCPFHIIRFALVRDRRAVVVGRKRCSDPSAVLADHGHREPAFRMVDIRDALVDRTDRLGVAGREMILLVVCALPVEVPHPVELGSDS